MSAVRRNVVAIAVAAMVAGSAPAAAPPGPPGPSPDARTAAVTFVSRGETLQGTVIAPPADGRRHPAVVLVAGAGVALPLDESRRLAEPLTAAGIVTLVYEKHTAGYSATERSYPLLADDALGAVDLLGDRADVDPERIGLWGISEGAWVAPLAASRSADVGFVVLVSASGVPPAQQTAWTMENQLRHSGLTGAVPGVLPINAVRMATALGQFPEARYDTLSAVQRVRQPVLGLWGALDRTVPPAESVSLLRQALDEGGNDRYSLRVLPSAGHTLHRSPDGYVDQYSFTSDFLPPVAEWINGLPGPPSGQADPAPPQDRPSVAVDGGTGIASPAVQLGALALFAVLFGGHLLTGLARRLVGRPRPVVARSARVLAVTGLLAPAGLFGYLAALLLTQSPGPVVAGTAVPFLVVRVLVAVAVAAAVATGVLWWRRRRDVGPGERVRLGSLLVGGVLLVPWAAYWGLLI